MIISVIGEGNARPDIAELAERVGAELARRGVSVVCGGLGGVMEAACRGAKSAGGTTIGILPGNDPNDGNQWVDIPILTGMGYARNVIVVKTGMAAIAVGGAFGTLSEIGHALGDGIPVIGLQTWGLSRNGETDKTIVMASSPADAVDKAIEAAENRVTSLEQQTH
ncbi:MAG: TIGR00725 family protein [Chloroflexi bacterium]|nr:TIGR00725 family protein [Chloroflexota bacterium]MCI0771097.1 TIGR00725 family protein [Chloroflexota bacterium]MCI0887352.1 TIGR00725 family protein [Chloroflexota bacterium]